MSDPSKDPKVNDVNEKAVDEVRTAVPEGEVADTDLEGASGGTFTVLSLGDKTPIDDTRGKPRKGTQLWEDSL